MENNLSIPERYAQNNPHLYFTYKSKNEDKEPIYNATFVKYKDRIMEAIQEEEKIEYQEEKAYKYTNQWQEAIFALTTMIEAFRTDDKNRK